jgi:AcrR family transcriptional regulator
MGTMERRQREAEARRKVIVEAARKVFLEKGYAKATMPQIAAEAELAAGTLYLYFPSKDALYVELLVEGYDILIPKLGAAARQGGNAVEVGGRMIDTFIGFAREFPEYFDIIFLTLQREKQGWERFPEDQVRRLNEKEHACRTIVEGVLEQAHIGTSESRTLSANSLWSMLAGVVFYFRSRDSFDAVAAEARRLLLSAVFGQTPA